MNQIIFHKMLNFLTVLGISIKIKFTKKYTNKKKKLKVAKSTWSIQRKFSRLYIKLATELVCNLKLYYRVPCTFLKVAGYKVSCFTRERPATGNYVNGDDYRFADLQGSWTNLEKRATITWLVIDKLENRLLTWIFIQENT